MIKYYQELLNECIDLAKNKRLQKEMLSTLKVMKNNLISLKGENK